MAPHRPTQPIPILVNREGGTAASAGPDLEDTIRQACTEVGITAEVQLLDGAEMTAAVEARKHHPLIVVGGGDGTLGQAAGALIAAGSSAVLGILPLGTHNHLALQLGIPKDIAGAIRTLAEGEERRIDVGTVNDLVFLNNASIGLYPLLVRSREAGRRRHGMPKWLANLFAGAAVMRRLRHHRLRVEIAGSAETIRTPLLFVGNNVYSLERGQIGQRAALDEGKLSVFAVATNTRLSVIWFALRALVGRTDAEKDFAALQTCRDFTVNAHAADIHVALDGELHQLRTPLRFESKPGALRVMVPREDAANS
ncbi:diacylglycerol/lipid kinase family protein [Sphingomonas crusticola]|uniref:diacylglycerol/lipid kinase family protein n=1 Tax=Sphingomonas crusticola TaxID=1697973 RepID=UPI000E26A5BE|nr:diacylglycerol kinase family protein [Sphingomonas crusticola]